MMAIFSKNLAITKEYLQKALYAFTNLSSFPCTLLFEI